MPQMATRAKGGDEGDEEGFLSAPKGRVLALEFGSESFVSLAFFPPKKAKGNEECGLRDGVDEGAFGKKAQGQPEGEEDVVERGPAVAIHQLVQGRHRENDEEDERHIRDGEARMNEDLQGREPAGSSQKREFAVEPHPARKEEEEDGDEPGGLHRVHAGPEFVDAKDLKVGAHPPVGEGRLVEAILVVEVGHDPLAAVDHLDGGMGEAWFVAVDKGQRPNARDEGRDGNKSQAQRREEPVDESRFVQDVGLKEGRRVCEKKMD